MRSEPQGPEFATTTGARSLDETHSWLDQAEIYFSVVQRKALRPNDFTSLNQIRDRLAAFETRYNAIATPFRWKFTRTDLADLLHRIDAHHNSQPHALAA